MFRRFADLVGKKLKGTKPAEIAFEELTKLEFVINLKRAKQIGGTITPEAVMWGNRVI